ncbi:hypothetical protein SAMN05216552_1006221 [Pseudoduganella namucuonensis]|uniref:Phosphotransferase n=2 Tax=Pseudoduganella namucuonensis TaxID=1035707 RepID=A0A1I7HVX4_9BURK|nr:hypothetical protein SAMN05216552_1006221 [Pseudoduganella namucuonensis]
MLTAGVVCWGSHGTIMCAPSQQRDHHEFEAALEAPYRLDTGGAPARVTLRFSQPGGEAAVRWRLELVDPAGRVLRRWRGRAALRDGAASVTVPVSAPSVAAAGAPGPHRLRIRAEPMDARGRTRGAEAVAQHWDVALAPPARLAMPPAGAAAAAAQALPYTVYYGNLHSQTSHSDGGGALDHCEGAQAPQSAPFGPDDAYEYARVHGLDFLLTSEHNHMYDGSEGTEPAADPARAKALYQSGLSAAAAYSAAHPGFLALYGMEWGVISNGGHLNILNSNELLGWERNGAGELLADTHTAKGGYAALYTLMRQRGWLGQFNHPKQSQFKVRGKALGYSEAGDEAMALCEVMNTSAFSTNTTETEGFRSNYEDSCVRLLEAGYHLAFASNQDNHCANWGMSYTNRTGVLIPEGEALTMGSFLQAIRARRVFATMDKQARLILTANGRLMGERFDNSGPLTLEVRHLNTAGVGASALSIVAGVPGKPGSSAPLPGAAAVTTITPEPGEHFYYARLTQEDGKLLWSAPVWVRQR